MIYQPNTLTNIYDTVSRKGGKALVLVQSSNSMMTYFHDSTIIMPLITIGPNKGKMFISSIENGDNKFKLQENNGLVERRNGGDINNFSSWGPTPNFELKPEISAPGGDIYSTLGNGEHGAMSGTSMSSPNVAGAVMLLKEGIAKKNINLSGIDLTKYIKIALMNTAEPLINDDNIPFSPRQQGAGMIKVEKAIKNNVTAVNEDGNAYIRLLNIGNEASFKIKLKNYGSDSVTYSLKDEDLYTETVENDLVKEIKIEGAKISFSTSSVTVKGNSEVEVTGKVTIPNTLEKNNYVEGYITLENKDEVSLNVPVLGFYGDWDSEKIMDDPCYEDSSLYKATGLGLSTGVYASFFYYYGTDNGESGVLPAGSVNKDKVVISPNGDDKFDTVDARVFRLRNSTLNEGNNVLQVKAWDNNNNCIYNKAYNVIVDTTAPSYEIICEKDELGNFAFKESNKVTFKLKVDDISKTTCIATNVNYGYEGKKVVASSDENNIITITMDDCNNINIIELDVYDELGNRCEKKQIKIYERRQDLQNIFIFQLDINEDPFTSNNSIYLNKDDLNEDGTYNLSGSFTSKPVSFKVNGEDVKVNDDFTFSKKVIVKEGVNIYDFKIIAYDWGEIQNINFKATIYYDDKAPEVTYNNLIEDNNGYIYTSNEVFILSGIAKDNNDYSLSINKSNIFTTTFDTTNNEGFKKEFIKAINLQDGENKILVEAEDINGNKYSKILKVILDKEKYKRKVLVKYVDKDTNKEITEH